MGDVRIRPARAEDAPFLTDMLVEAVNWLPGRDMPRTAALADPNIARYVAGWMRLDDVGVVAECDGSPIGAAWLRQLTADNPGFGYVADGVPELTIAVVTGWRGRGVGRSLLRALLAEARRRGLRRVSLSVEDGNAAVRLYRDEGFRPVGRADGATTMAADLHT